MNNIFHIQTPYIRRSLGTGLLSVLFVLTASAQVVGTPALTSPANGSDGIAVDVHFSWTAASGASSYHFQVSTMQDFSTLVDDESGIQSTSKDLVLNTKTTYYWRVQGAFLLTTGQWSDVSHFTTVPPLPAAPVLGSPANNASDQPIPMTFSYDTVPSATQYHLEVSTDSAFASVVQSQTASNGAPFVVNNLNRSQRYFWIDLLRHEGLCLGGSSGINVAGAIRLGKALGPGHTIVTVLCDSGTRYLSKLYNPGFLKEKGLPAPGWL